MKIDLELDGPLDELIDAFQDSPEKVSKAMGRSLRKLSRFAERAIRCCWGIQQRVLNRIWMLLRCWCNWNP